MRIEIKNFSNAPDSIYVLFDPGEGATEEKAWDFLESQGYDLSQLEFNYWDDSVADFYNAAEAACFDYKGETK